MSKSVMIIDTPIDCCDCPFGTMAFGKSICLLDEGNGIDCPLKPYDDFIPIEWIEDYLQKYTDMAGEYMGKDNDIAMYGIIRLNIISELLSAWKHKDDPHEYFPYVKGEGWKRVVENWNKENE